jgi:SHS2 domain-containing protein
MRGNYSGKCDFPPWHSGCYSCERAEEGSDGPVGRHEFVEGIAVADCAVEIVGDDLDDLFSTAALALADLMVDPATIRVATERQVELTAPSLDLLLYDWLTELIYLKDAEQLVFADVSARVSPGPPCRLAARLVGGPIDRATTALRADPKAVTFHQFELEPRDRGWRARVVIDI